MMNDFFGTVLLFHTDAASSVSFSSTPDSCQAPGAAQNLIFGC